MKTPIPGAQSFYGARLREPSVSLRLRDGGTVLDLPLGQVTAGRSRLRHRGG